MNVGKRFVVAVSAYTATDSRELSFDVGDVIEVGGCGSVSSRRLATHLTHRAGSFPQVTNDDGNGWSEGKRAGHVGWFPSAFVQPSDEQGRPVL